MKEIEIKTKKGEYLYIHAKTRKGEHFSIPKSKLQSNWRTEGRKYLIINKRRCSILYYKKKRYTNSGFYETDDRDYYLSVWVLDEPIVPVFGSAEKAAETRFFKFCKSGDFETFLADTLKYYGWYNSKNNPFFKHLTKKLKQIEITRDCENCLDRFKCYTRK